MAMVSTFGCWRIAFGPPVGHLLVTLSTLGGALAKTRSDDNHCFGNIRDVSDEHRLQLNLDLDNDLFNNPLGCLGSGSILPRVFILMSRGSGPARMV